MIRRGNDRTDNLPTMIKVQNIYLFRAQAVPYKSKKQLPNMYLLYDVKNRNKFSYGKKGFCRYVLKLSERRHIGKNFRQSRLGHIDKKTYFGHLGKRCPRRSHW